MSTINMNSNLYLSANINKIKSKTFSHKYGCKKKKIPLSKNN